MDEMRQDVARFDERLLTVEREIRDVKNAAATMDERQRVLLQDVSEAKGGIRLFKWVWAAALAVAGVVITLWQIITK
jgi:hypothetical protein